MTSFLNLLGVQVVFHESANRHNKPSSEGGKIESGWGYAAVSLGSSTRIKPGLSQPASKGKEKKLKRFPPPTLSCFLFLSFFSSFFFGYIGVLTAEALACARLAHNLDLCLRAKKMNKGGQDEENFDDFLSSSDLKRVGACAHRHARSWRPGKKRKKQRASI